MEPLWLAPAAGARRGEPQRPGGAEPGSGPGLAAGGAGSSRAGGSQALASLAAASLDHLAPARARHADTKAVRLAPVAFLGLVGALDGSSPGIRSRCGRRTTAQPRRGSPASIA